MSFLFLGNRQAPASRGWGGPGVCNRPHTELGIPTFFGGEGFVTRLSSLPPHPFSGEVFSPGGLYSSLQRVSPIVGPACVLLQEALPHVQTGYCRATCQSTSLLGLGPLTSRLLYGAPLLDLILLERRHRGGHSFCRLLLGLGSFCQEVTITTRGLR